MAGSVSVTVTRYNRGGSFNEDYVYVCSCVGGAADGGSVPSTAVAAAIDVAGLRLVSIETIPGAGGLAPDAPYAVAVRNSRATDLLGGTGAGRSTTANEIAFPTGAPAFIDSALTLVVGDLGNSNAVTIVLVISR